MPHGRPENKAVNLPLKTTNTGASVNLPKLSLTEAGDNQYAAKEGGQICPTKTSNEEAAKKLNVSKASVKTAKQVKEKGSPELVAAVESGKVAVSDAVVVVDLTTDADIIYFPFAIPMAEYFVPLVMTTAPS